MFGVKLSENIQINIGDTQEEALEKVRKFISGEDGLWADMEEMEDKMLTTKITVYSKGPVVPYEQVKIYINDEYVTYVDIFGSKIYDKLIIKGEEITANEACTKYKDKYVRESFCKKLNKKLAEDDAIQNCEYAKKLGCNPGCEYNRHERRYINLEDDNMIIMITESGFDGALIGKDANGKPIYSVTERGFADMGLECYSSDEGYTNDDT